VLETAVRRSKVENGGTIFFKCSQLMAYAADMVIMGKDYKREQKDLHLWSNKQIGWD
jgi:hypothetical protein